jgi:hypothetical protein
MFLHEVGDAVFLRDKDELIDLPDYVIGIYDAAMSIGRRYLNEQVINEIRSETYINILGKLSLHPLGIEFTRKELLEQFSEIEAVKEKRNIDNFIRRMKKLGVIKYEYLKYTFVNDLYHLYFKLLLEAFAKKKKA